jgi:hypothetical protein
MPNVTMNLTELTDRPAVQIALTNNEAIARTVRVRRTSGVAGSKVVRWLMDVPLAASGNLTAIDDEAPLGVPFTYALYIDDVFYVSSSSISLDGPWVVDGAPSWAWLRHLTAPALSTPVLISSSPELTREGRYGEHVPIGAALPVVTYAPRAGRTGDISLVTLTGASRDSVIELLRDGSVLQLAADPRFGVDSGGLYMAVTSAVEVRPVDNGNDDARLWNLSVTEVAAPPVAGQQGSLRDYNDLLSEWSDYAELRDSGQDGVDYFDVLTGIYTQGLVIPGPGFDPTPDYPSEADFPGSNIYPGVD